ncbi:WW domain-binding protein 4 [Leguminivora glycinivorella]|uniref:WW domain-binding protein 4 n=1 Tax=Leguminivora glycinivorella TaxID=1035111 RepID=UPI00200DDA4E|nr:WW domain-binding protein 4 [Leguminivora glycinivorella]
MTEYWKSQARKYCEFCKCWFADNKVSISFHEGGKRHKENVQKHISQITKKSTKEFKQKEKIDDDLKKMEAAAMAAYLKDVQNNADLTSQSINNMLGESTSEKNDPVVEVPQARAAPVWHEVKADDGSYFWNTETNETTWDPPDHYLSLADQEKEKLKEEEAKKIKKKQKEQKHKEAVVEAKAHLARESMRALSVKKEAPRPSAGMEFGPAPRAANPYGSWKAVENKPVEQIDLQLPKPDKEVLPPPVVMEPEARATFGERRVDSLGQGPVEFKKRKLNNPKRNMRQKLDDD